MKAISSIKGRILSIAMAINHTLERAEFNYRPFFEGFPKEVEFFILIQFNPERYSSREPLDQYQREMRAEISRENERAGRNPENTQVFFSPNLEICFTRWIQDPMMILKREEKTHGRILKPFPGRNSAFFADQFGYNLSMDVVPIPIAFEGGQILVNEEYALVGKDVLLINQRDTVRICSKTVKRIPMLEAEVVAELKAKLGVAEVIFVGFDVPQPQTDFLQSLKSTEQTANHTYQPLFHLDVFATLMPSETKGKRQLMIAEVGKQWTIPRTLTEQQKKELKSLKMRLDIIAQMMEERYDFVVHRLPMVMNMETLNRGVYSYNNAQLEQKNDQATAFIPAYHLPAEEWPGGPAEALNKLFLITDKLASVNYKKNGFSSVVQIKGPIIFESGVLRGSVRCLTKVLARDPDPSSRSEKPGCLRKITQLWGNR